jgi:RNA-directed DNA polymerase
MNNKQFFVDLFQAYYHARKNKRRTRSSIAFEMNYEQNLLELGRELLSGNYKIGRSICFISFKPLQREIFAADFRDRIIHHLIFDYINHIFERSFIYDSYSCRLDKGTSLGIKRLDHFIRSCSKNYKKDCYILKLDLKGYFMSIDKNILYQKLETKINNFTGICLFDRPWLLALIKQVIFHDPTKDCEIRGKKENWQGLPRSKSLFWVDKDKGLPIGNLTSQLFGNIYLDDFDHFVKYKLGCKYYGRYVDDMVIVHHSHEYLKSTIGLIRKYLKKELGLELHPRKIYLQHYKKGVSFLGAILKPYRKYIRNNTKGNYYRKIRYWNQILQNNKNNLPKDYQYKFVSSLNSYLGILNKFQTYKLRQRTISESLSSDFSKYFNYSKEYIKIELK